MELYKTIDKIKAIWISPARELKLPLSVISYKINE